MEYLAIIGITVTVLLVISMLAFSVYMVIVFFKNSSAYAKIAYAALFIAAATLAVIQATVPELASAALVTSLAVAMTATAYVVHLMQLAWDKAGIARWMQYAALVLAAPSSISTMLARKVLKGYWMPPLK